VLRCATSEVASPSPKRDQLAAKIGTGHFPSSIHPGPALPRLTLPAIGAETLETLRLSTIVPPINQ
jgi:hypothetical protein